MRFSLFLLALLAAYTPASDPDQPSPTDPSWDPEDIKIEWFETEYCQPRVDYRGWGSLGKYFPPARGGESLIRSFRIEWGPVNNPELGFRYVEKNNGEQQSLFQDTGPRCVTVSQGLDWYEVYNN